MIVLENGISNKVALTLTEKATLTTPYYLFEFIDDDSNISILFTGADISTNTNRYNEFLIEVNLSPIDLLDSKIELVTKGYYKYNVYEQVSATNLLIANTTSLVENGKMYFNDIVLPIKKEYTDEPNTKFVYNG